MKILFLNYEFPPLGGGAGNATSYILKEFSKIPDLQVDLVTSSIDKFRIEDFSSNIKIHFLDINKKNNFHFQSQKDLLVYSWKAYFYCKKLIKKEKFDLTLAFFGIPCGYIAMKLKIPYIISLRGSDVPGYNERFKILDKFVFSWLSRKIWKKSEKVIALSDDLVNLAKKNAPNQGIKVIYNGINTDEFFPDNQILEKESNINILFVGRLIQRKGLNYLLEAFRELYKKNQNIRLLIAGDGPLKEVYKKYVSDNGLNEKIIFLGRLEHEQLPAIYKKSHIFVLPSLNEALGNVTHEAIASGLPIITTNTGAAELISGNGIIINKNSSKEIKDALLELIDNPEKRRQMSEESRKIAAGMKWEKTASEYYKLFKSYQINGK